LHRLLFVSCPSYHYRKFFLIVRGRHWRFPWMLVPIMRCHCVAFRRQAEPRQ
jgi:hypothetical protein